MMKTIPYDPNERAALRARAVTHLKGSDAQAHARARADTSAALGVLYELACSPSTAPDALALLHELQVHQVEVDLQDEELRRGRNELETLLNRQVQIYDYAPVGIVTVDGDAVVQQVNRKGANLLGMERDFLRGRSLESVLAPDGVLVLRAMLGRITEGGSAESADLPVRAAQDGSIHSVHVSACPDPAGAGFLIAVIGVPGAKDAPVAG